MQMPFLVCDYCSEIIDHEMLETGKDDTVPQVEIMWGNGLRPSIWQQFTERLGSVQNTKKYKSTIL